MELYNIKEMWPVYFFSAAIFSIGGWCAKIHSKTRQNCEGLKMVNAETIPRIKTEITDGIKKELRHMKVEALEDKIMFIEFRKENKEATAADEVMLKQYVRRLKSLSQQDD